MIQSTVPVSSAVLVLINPAEVTEQGASAGGRAGRGEGKEAGVAGETGAVSCALPGHQVEAVVVESLLAARGRAHRGVSRALPQRPPRRAGKAYAGQTARCIVSVRSVTHCAAVTV